MLKLLQVSFHKAFDGFDDDSLDTGPKFYAVPMPIPDQGHRLKRLTPCRVVKDANL